MILLTSSVATVADHLFKNYLADKGYKTVLFIDTAAEPEIGLIDGDDAWLQADFELFLNHGYQVDRYTITRKTREDIESAILSHDIIYMSGGNTLYLLHQLQITNSFDLIKKLVSDGKTYISSSAGSIIAGAKIPLYLEEPEDFEIKNETGFQFTNAIIVPHWGSDYFKEMYLEQRIKLAYQASEPPFILLSDWHYLAIEGKQMEVIDTNE